MITNKFITRTLFAVLLISVIAQRYFVLINFGFDFTDSDQAIMWQGLKDYANGNFYEPRFYGQAYSSMLEALFAVPLYKLGMAPSIALPLVTSIFTLFPFISFSFLAFIKKREFIGLFILSIPLLLPLEYSLITSLSRGFVSGIFISSFGILLVLNEVKYKFIYFGFFAVLSYSINPNSVILTLPFALYLFWENKRTLLFYRDTIIGIAFGAVLHFWAAWFYYSNPSYNIHQFSLYFSLSDLYKGISNIDGYINQVSPLFWKNSFITILLMFAFGVISFAKKKISLGLLLLSAPILILLVFGINKVHDGYDSIFFSKSRMFLAFPVMIALVIYMAKSISFKYKYLFFLIPIVLFFYKLSVLDEKIIQYTTPSASHIVGIQKVAELKKDCRDLNKIAKAYKADLIIIVNSYAQDFINYSCSSCELDFPYTLRPSYERRTWRLTEDKNKVYETILIIDFKNQYPSLTQIDNRTFLIKNNTLNTMEVLKKWKIECRNF